MARIGPNDSIVPNAKGQRVEQGTSLPDWNQICWVRDELEDVSPHLVGEFHGSVSVAKAKVVATRNAKYLQTSAMQSPGLSPARVYCGALRLTWHGTLSFSFENTAVRLPVSMRYPCSCVMNEIVF